MNTQQFRPLLSLRTLRVLLFTALSLLLIVGCEEYDDYVSDDAELERSNDCKPPCSGSNLDCFKDPLDPSGPSACYELNCPLEQPVTSCAEGATCTDSGQCVFEVSCTPECSGNEHCVAGNCVPDYTSENVCDPLENCRNQCGSGSSQAACVQACERDRSLECERCMTRFSKCRKEEGAEPSPTGVCSDEYCACFPGTPECSDGPPCTACWNQCKASTDPVECLNNCVGNYPSCAECLQPFSNQCTDGSSGELSPQCTELFVECTGSAP